MNRTVIAAALAVAGAWAGPALAQGAPNESDLSDRTQTTCRRPADAHAVVRCALAASPEIRAARAQIDAAAGRRETAGVLLPSNPTVSGNVANRRRPAPEETSVLNWSVTLSQELEIGGQRAARVGEADAALGVQARRLKVVEQEVAAGALTAYYEALAAQESLRFAAQLAGTSDALAVYAAARAKEALAPGVEADVARAEATRIGLARFEAERRLTEARATLAALLGVQPDELALPAALAAPPAVLPSGPLEERALKLRGEIGAAEMERQVLERRLALVRRQRVPNPTLSAFLERDEINDRIIGLGLAIPLPLPAPVGRTRAGEITETLAQIRAAEASEELVRRRVRLEVTRALAAVRARDAAASLFASDLITRARADLSALREAIAARQLTLREALQWQRSLIELLQADIDARLARALAWVDLRRVVGLSLDGGTGGSR